MQPIKSNFLLFQPIDWSFQLSKSQMQSVSVNEDRFHYYCRSQYKDIFWPRVFSSRSDMSCFCLLLPFLNLHALIRNIFHFLIWICSFSYFWLSNKRTASLIGFENFAPCTFIEFWYLLVYYIYVLLILIIFQSIFVVILMNVG